MGVGWSCALHVHHPEVVLSTHEDYLYAGADMVTANTYATNRNILDAAGLGDRSREINTSALEIAEKSVENVHRSRSDDSGMRPLVAGSISTHSPGKLVDKLSKEYKPGWPENGETEVAHYIEQIEYLLEHKVDLIVVETLRDM